MLKGFFVVVVFCVGINCFAITQIGIDINGVKNKITLRPGSTSRNLKLVNSSDNKENSQYYLTASGNLKNLKKWTKYYFSFTPGEDGVVQIHLNSLVKETKTKKGKKKEISLWAAYDKITITGIEAKNCDFELLDDKNLFAGWNGNAKNTVTGSRKAKSGKSYIIVSDENPVFQALKLKKDRQVTVIFYAKASKGPARKTKS